MTTVRYAFAATLALALAGLACRDTARFTTAAGERFEGTVTAGSFVRAGLPRDLGMCLTLDTAHLQDAPGTLTTSDGRFRQTPLRPIPQAWHDPVSTLTFGDGRLQNLLYVAEPRPAEPEPDADVTDLGADIEDVMVLVSLMQSGAVEVRLVRGAPHSPASAVDPGVAPSRRDSARPRPIFGVFSLAKEEGPCSF